MITELRRYRIKPDKLFAEAEVDQNGVPTAPFEFGYDQPGAFLPLINHCGYHFRRNCRVVYQGDEGRFPHPGQ